MNVNEITVKKLSCRYSWKHEWYRKITVLYAFHRIFNSLPFHSFRILSLNHNVLFLSTIAFSNDSFIYRSSIVKHWHNRALCVLHLSVTVHCRFVSLKKRSVIVIFSAVIRMHVNEKKKKNTRTIVALRRNKNAVSGTFSSRSRLDRAPARRWNSFVKSWLSFCMDRVCLRLACTYHDNISRDQEEIKV